MAIVREQESSIRLFGSANVGLRDAGRRFLTSTRASHRYSARYLESLEFYLGLLAEHAEEQDWPVIGALNSEFIEDYLAYSQTRPRWFGSRDAAARPPSQSRIETQYRRIKRFFNWLVEMEYLARNPVAVIPHPHVNERTIPTVSMGDMANLLELVNPERARTDNERFPKDPGPGRIVHIVGHPQPPQRNHRSYHELGRLGFSFRCRLGEGQRY